jgi:hypothetical protein
MMREMIFSTVNHCPAQQGHDEAAERLPPGVGRLVFQQDTCAVPFHFQIATRFSDYNRDNDRKQISFRKNR